MEHFGSLFSKMNFLKQDVKDNFNTVLFSLRKKKKIEHETIRMHISFSRFDITIILSHYLEEFMPYLMYVKGPLVYHYLV